MRTTVRLDQQVLERSRRFIPPRGLSRFINQAVAEKLEALERQEVEALTRQQLKADLREGYIATRLEHAEVDADWKAIEVESWRE
jgi:hypothetical protein